MYGKLLYGHSVLVPYENNMLMLLLPADISKTCIPTGGCKQSQKDVIMYSICFAQKETNHGLIST